MVDWLFVLHIDLDTLPLLLCHAHQRDHYNGCSPLFCILCVSEYFSQLKICACVYKERPEILHNEGQQYTRCVQISFFWFKIANKMKINKEKKNSCNNIPINRILILKKCGGQYKIDGVYLPFFLLSLAVSF